MKNKSTYKVVPAQMYVYPNGYMPVTRVLVHPPGKHVGSPIIQDLTALELVTPVRSRWYGCEHAAITSRLRVVARFTDLRDEVVLKCWERPSPHEVVEVLTSDPQVGKHLADLTYAFDRKAWEHRGLDPLDLQKLVDVGKVSRAKHARKYWYRVAS